MDVLPYKEKDQPQLRTGNKFLNLLVAKNIMNCIVSIDQNILVCVDLCRLSSNYFTFLILMTLVEGYF